MSDVAIQVENLSKLYQIGARQAQHDTLRDQISFGFRTLLRKKQAGIEDGATFWALRDVSFSIRHGEVVGVIGRNGAGKSTLLKVLSRITEPTQGEANIYGRVSSLLEVGTGFHPELTGRENVYLNGAILGMKRAEIDRKFDEIVAFSEIDKFLDTPVKRYSSGMYVRLAFAVAAHLEPDILIVDEVLAVGDAMFQKKCLGKMGNVAREGRTVLFVSHNLPSVLNLCPNAILLDAGQIAFRGTSALAIEKYLKSSGMSTGEKCWNCNEATAGDQTFRPIRLRVCNHEGVPTDLVRSSEAFYVELEYKLMRAVPDFRIQFKLYSGLGEALFLTSDTDDPLRHQLHSVRDAGHYVSRCHIPADLFNKGIFVVGISASVPTLKGFFVDYNCITFTVDETGGVGSNWQEDRAGFFRPALHWEIEALPHH